MKLVKLNPLDLVLAMLPAVSVGVITGLVFLSRDFEGDTVWGIIMLSTLAWFYLSMLFAGITMLYGQHKFIVCLSYFAAILVFGILITVYGSGVFWGGILFFIAWAYLAAIFIFKFVIEAELRRLDIPQANWIDLLTLLVPFFASIGLIFGSFLFLFLGEENLISFTLDPSSQVTATWMIIGNYAYLAVSGGLIGVFGRIPISISIIAILSIISMTMFFAFIGVQDQWVWLNLFICFFLPFITIQIGEYFWHQRQNKSKDTK